MAPLIHTLGIRIGALALVVLAIAIALLLFTRTSQTEYRDWQADAETMIERLEPTATVATNAQQIDQVVNTLPDTQDTKVSLVSDSGRVSQVRYYRGRVLVVLDRNDERQQLTRRDVFDGSGRPRVRTFFGNGRAYLCHYLDESGAVSRVDLLSAVPAFIRPTY